MATSYTTRLRTELRLFTALRYQNAKELVYEVWDAYLEGELDSLDFTLMLKLMEKMEAAVPSRFASRLLVMLANFNFNLEDALSLSDSMHEAEGNGYEISDYEDLLWKNLTERIETERNAA